MRAVASVMERPSRLDASGRVKLQPATAVSGQSVAGQWPVSGQLAPATLAGPCMALCKWLAEDDAPSAGLRCCGKHIHSGCLTDYVP